jgi:hypothetical protein
VYYVDSVVRGWRSARQVQRDPSCTGSRRTLAFTATSLLSLISFMSGPTYGKRVVPPGCYFFTLLLVGSLVGAVGRSVPTILVIGRGICRRGGSRPDGTRAMPCHTTVVPLLRLLLV